MRAPLCLVAAIALAAPAAASDGALQINQACAVQTGCFSGDTAGFPVTIGTAGSYVLTGNLVVPDPNTTGILVSAASVHIDLNGFEIARSGCVGATVDCTPTSGSGRGVAVTGSPIPVAVGVENGSITGMGQEGVFLGRQATVRDLRVRWNRADGIAVAEGTIVSGNVVYDNVGTGIATLSGATISGNTAYGNGADGISTGNGSTVSTNTAYVNGGSGVHAGSGSTLSGNTVRGNENYGLELAATSAYRENTVTDNLTGTVLGGVNRGDNYCSGTGVVSEFCP